MNQLLHRVIWENSRVAYSCKMVSQSQHVKGLFRHYYAPVNWIPGRGGPGWGGDSAPTFCTILHSPRPPRHIFLSLIPAPRGTFFKWALKAHIYISLYENNTLQELLFLSVIPWGEIFAYCHHPAQPLEATGCGHVFQLGGRDHFRPLAHAYLMHH